MWWNLRRGRLQTKRDRRGKWRWRSRDQNRGPGLVSYGQRSRNICTFPGIITHFFLIEPEIKLQFFFPPLFSFAFKNILLNNKLHVQSLHLAGLQRNQWSLLLHLAVSIKHCVCPGTTLNTEVN